MSFFEYFFSKKSGRAESVVLVDIGANSVAAAYARYEEGKPPAILYAERLAIETREGEPRERAMLRALRVLGDNLIRGGAPILVRTTGSGSADLILVSVDAPWQETVVRTEHFDEDTPFTFTRNMVADKLKKANIASPEKMITDESIIGTVLNGYETNNPYGKKAHRAAVTILSSVIDRAVADSIISTIQSLFHTKRILPIAGSSLRYQALRVVFPHEEDALVLDATGGPLVSVALVRKGLFATMSQIPAPADNGEWAAAVGKALSEIAKNYPLPWTIFLIANESEMPETRAKLESIDFRSLWLADSPPKIVPVLASFVASSVTQSTTEPVDLVLLLIAIYYQQCNAANVCAQQ